MGGRAASAHTRRARARAEDHPRRRDPDRTRTRDTPTPTHTPGNTARTQAQYQLHRMPQNVARPNADQPWQSFCFLPRAARSSLLICALLACLELVAQFLRIPTHNRVGVCWECLHGQLCQGLSARGRWNGPEAQKGVDQQAGKHVPYKAHKLDVAKPHQPNPPSANAAVPNGSTRPRSESTVWLHHDEWR